MKKISIAVSTLCALALCCGFALRPAKSQAETQTRIGIRNHVYKAPLEVVGLNIGGRSIAAGDQFSAGRDWIKRLTITVKNTSDRDLIGVGASVEFPYDDKDQPQLPEIEFLAGFDPTLNLGATDFLLRPGDTTELQLPNGWHKAVDAVVKIAGNMGRPTLTHNVTATPIFTAFSSTEVWQRGSYRLFEDGKWKPNTAAMKRVAQEVRELLSKPRMFKASMPQTAQCGDDNGCTTVACEAGIPFACPTCLLCPGTTIVCSPGWRLRNRFVFCRDINGNCSCTLLVSEPNYAVPC